MKGSTCDNASHPPRLAITKQGEIEPMNEKLAKIESYIFELYNENKSLKEQLANAQDVELLTMDEELDGTLATIEMMRAENGESIKPESAIQNLRQALSNCRTRS